MEENTLRNGAFHSSAGTVIILCARIWEIAVLFRNVDFPDALEPVIRFPPETVKLFGTAF